MRTYAVHVPSVVTSLALLRLRRSSFTPLHHEPNEPFAKKKQHPFEIIRGQWKMRKMRKYASWNDPAKSRGSCRFPRRSKFLKNVVAISGHTRLGTTLGLTTHEQQSMALSSAGLDFRICSGFGHLQQLQNLRKAFTCDRPSTTKWTGIQNIYANYWKHADAFSP